MNEVKIAKTDNKKLKNKSKMEASKAKTFVDMKRIQDFCSADAYYEIF